jgi:hypothetical protein
MHPMFAELFMRPDEELEHDDRRRPRRRRQLKTLSAARGASGATRGIPAGRRAG